MPCRRQILSRTGVHGVLNGRDAVTLIPPVSELERVDGTAMIAPFDVTNPEAIRSAVDAIDQQFGRLDVPVNNAGIVTRNLLQDLTGEDWQSVIDTDLTACFRLAREASLFVLDEDPTIDREWFKDRSANIDADHIAAYDAIFLAAPAVPAATMMKPDAFLINTARGSIVDEQSLYRALRARRIGGAAVDVIEQEPVLAANPPLTLDNIFVPPHAICYTDECLRLLDEGAFEAAGEFLNRRLPYLVVNPEVLARRGMKRWFGAP